MRDMTRDEYRSFLMDTVRTGKVATVRADGRPHVVPVWYILDGEEIVFTSWHETIKVRNIRRDPRVAISVDDQQPPFSFVLIEGEAEILEIAPDELLPWTTRIARRYMGDELAAQFGKRNAVAGERLIRVRPTKVVAKMNLSD